MAFTLARISSAVVASHMAKRAEIDDADGLASAMNIAFWPASRNAVAAASCVLARDQRDYLRPAGACDIGAMDVDAASTPDALFQGGFE